MNGWPTIADYCAAAQREGCRIVQADGAVTITSPAGLSVTEFVATPDEPLASTTIARLDRRLGHKTWLYT